MCTKETPSSGGSWAPAHYLGHPPAREVSGKPCWDACGWAHELIAAFLGLPAAPPGTLCVCCGNSGAELDLLLPLVSRGGAAGTPLGLVWSCASLGTTSTEPALKEPLMFSHHTRGAPGSCLPAGIKFLPQNPFLCLFPVLLAGNTGLSKQLRCVMDTILQFLGRH